MGLESANLCATALLFNHNASIKLFIRSIFVNIHDLQHSVKHCKSTDIYIFTV